MKYILSIYVGSVSDQESGDKPEFLFSHSSRAHGEDGPVDHCDNDSGIWGQECLTWQIKARSQSADKVPGS